MEQYESYLPLPLAPSLEGFVGSVTLVRVSAVTASKGAACKTTGPDSHGLDFCPLSCSSGDGAGQTGCSYVWPEICSLYGTAEEGGQSVW